MSATLKYEPGRRKSKSLPDELKFVLRDKCGLDGDHRPYDSSHIPYLSGLDDAGVKGARELIEAIEKYEIVDVWLEY